MIMKLVKLVKDSVLAVSVILIPLLVSYSIIPLVLYVLSIINKYN